MKKLRKLIIFTVLALSAACTFAEQVKDRSYYAEHYQRPGFSKQNISLLQQNNAELMEGITKKYLDVNYEYEGGNTLLHCAIMNYCYEPETFIRIADFLIKNGANPNIQNKEGITPLLYAVQHLNHEKNLSIINFLLSKKADPKIYDRKGNTVLYLLCREKKPDLQLAKRFIKLGVSLDKGIDGGFTPLTYAFYNKNIELAKLLVENGADVNLKDGNDYIPILEVCRTGNLALLKLMHSKGGDINI